MGNIQEAQNALNSEEVSEKIITRDRLIVRTSVIGILANVFLSAFKAVIGLLTHSIAILMDAVNNLTDAASSLITIIGTKLAAKEPDKEHPFGHGRAEYLSAMVIAVLVLYAGVTSLIESIKKIITPKKPEYTAVALVIVAVAVVVKIVLGRYVKSMGEKTNSDALVNSGQDATMDSVISASTLVAAFIFQASGLSLEAWLGAIISVIIIKSGIDMLRETISQLLGERIDRELALGIKETVTSFPDVQGAYDLILNNYGPNAFNGSVHIEVPDTYTAYDLDDLLRQITIEVFEKHNVILTAIGVYSVNTKNDFAAKVRDDVSKIVFKNKYALQMHGFYLNEEKKTIRFDVVVSFDAPDRKEVYHNIVKEVNAKYPDYTLQIALDSDFSD
ncbi:MAG: cation transporter [Lachnospiraceae bacterium]|nr:cation transporter [Lachnospiraceae bacterium]